MLNPHTYTTYMEENIYIHAQPHTHIDMPLALIIIIKAILV